MCSTSVCCKVPGSIFVFKVNFSSFSMESVPHCDTSLHVCLQPLLRAVEFNKFKTRRNYITKHSHTSQTESFNVWLFSFTKMAEGRTGTLLNCKISNKFRILPHLQTVPTQIIVQILTHFSAHRINANQTLLKSICLLCNFVCMRQWDSKLLCS